MDTPTWPELKTSLDRRASLPPAELDALARDLDRFIEANPDSPDATEAAKALQQLHAQAARPPSPSPEARRRQIDAAQAMLGSVRDRDVIAGINRLFNLLQHDPEDPEIYPLLIQTARERPARLNDIQGPLRALARSGSHSAQRTLDELSAPPPPSPSPTSPADDLSRLSLTELVEKADDAYYATEYDRAIKLYQEVLKRDPANAHAQAQIKKAELNKDGEKLDPSLPRAVVQLYRRARSYIGARDPASASSALEAALQTAEKVGVPFPQAQDLLYAQQNALVAQEYKDKGLAALEQGKWSEAVTQFERALSLDPGESASAKLLPHLNALLEAQAALDVLEKAPGTLTEQAEKLQAIQKAVEESGRLPYLDRLRESVIARFSQLDREYKNNISKAMESGQWIESAALGYFAHLRDAEATRLREQRTALLVARDRLARLQPGVTSEMVSGPILQEVNKAVDAAAGQPYLSKLLQEVVKARNQFESDHQRLVNEAAAERRRLRNRNWARRFQYVFGGLALLAAFFGAGGFLAGNPLFAFLALAVGVLAMAAVGIEAFIVDAVED